MPVLQYMKLKRTYRQDSYSKNKYKLANRIFKKIGIRVSFIRWVVKQQSIEGWKRRFELFNELLRKKSTAWITNSFFFGLFISQQLTLTSCSSRKLAQFMILDLSLAFKDTVKKTLAATGSCYTYNMKQVQDLKLYRYISEVKRIFHAIQTRLDVMVHIYLIF